MEGTTPFVSARIAPAATPRRSKVTPLAEGFTHSASRCSTSSPTFLGFEGRQLLPDRHAQPGGAALLRGYGAWPSPR